MSENPTTAAVRSLLDVVEELCLGLAAGQTPHTEWADIVSKSFAEHRQGIREGELPAADPLRLPPGPDKPHTPKPPGGPS
jgi:hypothetical protein